MIGITLPVLAIAGLALGQAPPAQLPEEARSLETLVHDEHRLLDAARQYDRMQQAQIDWDLDMAKELAAQGDSASAETKANSAQQRARNIAQVYQYILKHYPNSARAITYYAELLYDRLEEPDKAIEYWLRACKLDRKYGPPRNNLAIHYCHVGEYERGLKYADQALECEPDNPDFLFNMAQFYLVYGPQVGKLRQWNPRRVYEEAMRLSKRSAELAPGSYPLTKDYAQNFFVAENFQVEADWRAAAEAWQRARQCARHRDDEFFTWLNEGRVWLRARDNERAVQCLQEALKINPGSQPARNLLDTAQKDLGAANPTAPGGVM